MIDPSLFSLARESYTLIVLVVVGLLLLAIARVWKPLEEQRTQQQRSVEATAVTLLSALDDAKCLVAKLEKE